ncbi:hypothetical protein UY3_02112 [Chelonia mydas]|uniref:C2H2-type domain-containing protein n=1 Tax=Chelonia mydas TaxID=8469 RepID=M7CI44_CHEMY|nr:hypothetical protein UY3_02112 [Chelonia mydas]
MLEEKAADTENQVTSAAGQQGQQAVTDVIQQLLELSEPGPVENNQPQQPGQQLNIAVGLNRDILQQALENSGLSSIPVSAHPTDCSQAKNPTTQDHNPDVQNLSSHQADPNNAEQDKEQESPDKMDKKEKKVIKKKSPFLPGVRPFACPHCDKKFRTSGHRKTHIASHFKHTELRKMRHQRKPAKVRIGKTSVPVPDIPLQEPILITDLGLIQPIPRNSQFFQSYFNNSFGNEADRPYKCYYCNRAYKKSCHLKQHIRYELAQQLQQHQQAASIDDSTVDQQSIHVSTQMQVEIESDELQQPEAVTTDQEAILELDQQQVVTTEETGLGQQLTDQPLEQDEDRFVTSQHTLQENINQFEQQTLTQQSFDQQGLSQVVCVEEDEENSERTASRKSRPGVITFTEEETAELAKIRPRESATVSEKVLVQSAAEKDRISEIKDKHAELEAEPKYANCCTYCPKSFKKPSDLVRHVRIHTGEKPYKCDECGKSFTVKSTLDCHVKTHTGQKLFSCHVCTGGDLTVSLTDGSLATLEGIQLQLAANLVGQNVQISGIDAASINNITLQIDPSILQQTLQQSNLLAQHLTGDPSMAPQNNSLQTTDSTVPANVVIQPISGLSLQPTVTSSANMTIGPLSEQDSVLTTNSSELNTSSGNLPSTPPMSQSTVSAQNLVMSSSGVGGDGSVTLTLADTQGMLSSGLDSVTLNITSQVAEVSSNLTKGSQVEKEGRVHQCFECSETFSSATMLMHHSKEVHGKERIHVCHVCNKAFKRATHLKEHMQTHQAGPSLSSQKPRVFKCDTCEKAFAKPSQLERHSRIHTGERPFQCTLCDKAFNQKSALQVHMKKHTGERPYKCDYCAMGFTQKSNMKLHMKRAHGYAGTIQESASQQEGEDINRALNLEEVVQESSNEWQSISNVFR